MTRKRSVVPCLCSVVLLAASPALASLEDELLPLRPALPAPDAESAEAALERAVRPVPSKAISLLLQSAVNNGLISGGVAAVGTSHGMVSVTARGKVDETTIFDLASLTKVVATAPAVMKLVQSGKVDLSDRLDRWFPEFKGRSLGKITVHELLTHTSGLADGRLRKGQAMGAVIRKAAAESTRHRSQFNYADINFILLGELVHRTSGKPLDVFCREEIFKPLGMKQTMFRPPEEMDGMIAPTAGVGRGIVQDLTARRLGRVAGHAGLFSSAADLSRFARLILQGGALEGRRIFSESVITEMTSPHICRPKTIKRGLGWDISSPFSAPKGRLLSRTSFGHTGYSGSSIWIDPQSNLFVILLTKRIDYTNIHSFNKLRENISTVAAAQFGTIDERLQAAAEREMASIVAKASVSHHHKRIPTVRHAKINRHGKGRAQTVAHVRGAKHVKKLKMLHKGRHRV